MPMFQMQMETDHGILFLADSSPDIAIPDDTGKAFSTQTHDCIVFWVRHYVDGATLVTISDKACEKGSEPVFGGSIVSPTGIVTLSDSGGFSYLNMPVKPGTVTVTIWADNENHPEWVWVRLASFAHAET